MFHQYQWETFSLAHDHQDIDKLLPDLEFHIEFEVGSRRKKQARGRKKRNYGGNYGLPCSIKQYSKVRGRLALEQAEWLFSGPRVLELRPQVQIGLREKLLQFFPTNLYVTDSKSQGMELWNKREVRAAWSSKKSIKALSSGNYITNSWLTHSLPWTGSKHTLCESPSLYSGQSSPIRTLGIMLNNTGGPKCPLTLAFF